MRAMTVGIIERSCLLFLLLLSSFVQHTALGFSITSWPTRHSDVASLHACRGKVAVLGSDLSGIVAALVAAEQQDGEDDIEVMMVTGQENPTSVSQNTELEDWPDPLLNNRQILERLTRGGKELAGMLATVASPQNMQNWLNDHGIRHVSSEDEDEDQGRLLRSKDNEIKNTLNILAKEKILSLAPSGISGVESLWNQLESAGVRVISGVRNTTVRADGSCSFQINYSKGGDEYSCHVDRIILAGDPQQQHSMIRLGDQKPKMDTSNAFSDLVADDNEPVSRKEQMILEKKRAKLLKKKERKRQAMGVKQNMHIVESKSATAPDEVKVEQSDGSILLNATAIAESLGHTTIPQYPGLCSFRIQHKIQQSCPGSSTSSSPLIIPKARLRCQLRDPPKQRRRRPLRVEGPLSLSLHDGLLSGPACWKLSSSQGHLLLESNYQDASLHVHFAPDLGGTEEIQEKLVEYSDPSASVMGSSCPLVHSQVDYDDYDFEAGDFRQITFPLVPDALWEDLCRKSKVKSTVLWRDIDDGTLQRLARVMVDYSLAIQYVDPEGENWTAGGVSLKEVSFPDCQSRLLDGLYLCGVTALDAHGSNSAINGLVSVSTGYMAGMKCSYSLTRSVD